MLNELFYPSFLNICSLYVGVHCFLVILTAPSLTTASFWLRCESALQNWIEPYLVELARRKRALCSGWVVVEK